MSSHRPVGPLACPARFERATYALEGRKRISYKRHLIARSETIWIRKQLVLSIPNGAVTRN